MHSATTRGSPSRRGRPPKSWPDSPSEAAASDSTTEPPSSLVSSLHIAVQGTVPINPAASDTSSSGQVNGAPLQSSTSESRRAPRKSKTEALAALQSHAESSSAGGDDLNALDDDAPFFRTSSPIPVPETLNLRSVKTSSPRRKQADEEPRHFGLENCPVFFPTAEQFKDAAAYVRSISDVARSYGICKIVPPEGWKMPFVTNTESFRFKTRLQRLNSIEASSRAKINFLEQLYRWHKQQGNSRVAVPTINHKPLDLWLLRKEVDGLGGYEAVNREKKWSELGTALGYGGIPGLSTQLKNSYTRVILPYEHFVRNSPSMPPGSRDPNSRLQSTGISSGFNNTGDTSIPSSPLSVESSPLSKPPDDAERREVNGRTESRRMSRNGLHAASSGVSPPVFHDKKDVREASEQTCEICHKTNNDDKMLLCDGCDCGFHTYCLVPELLAIPKGQWFCHKCLSQTGVDYGFDEGEEHSLSTFLARDLAFRRIWFESHPPPNRTRTSTDDYFVNKFGGVFVSEGDVEEEFWRLVQSPHEIVEVEYGADVHSTTHGSAMPTLETHPLDPYSKDPWNLNNLPITSDSLLRFIKSDISGMTVPWTYVGMVFSTFCWHNEDHYTYSINFMHWGETKTWYGIPGDDAEKFEAAIKMEAPDLFEAQPDLLFQLVTLMNPKRVRDAGVRVYACNQRAGEFVITFPKAYHAGFNHGLNFNEAVNFALPDWLSFGRDCVQRYRVHRKLPVFSHDELLITITQQSQSIATAIWLRDSLQEMIDREMGNRNTARSIGLSEILEEEDRPIEEQYQCTICKMFCYLSQVVCSCTTKVVCVEHANLLCAHDTNYLKLRKRFSDEELRLTLDKVAERAVTPTTWKQKLQATVKENARPSLRTLRALLAEGERINYPLLELRTLRLFVSRANDWVESANAFIIRKPSRKRSRRSRGKPSSNEPNSNAMEDIIEKPEHSLRNLYSLLREILDLGFDCPEIGILQAHGNQAEDLKTKAGAILEKADAEQDRDKLIQECERLLLEASSLNVYLDEIVDVERIVSREQLIRELEKLDDDSMTLEEVGQLLTRARACNLDSEDRCMKHLEIMHNLGEEWVHNANRLLNEPHKTIDGLTDRSNSAQGIAIDPAVLDRLRSALAKAKDFEKQAKAWLQPEGGKSRVQEVLKLVSRAEKDFSIPSVQELKRIADIAADLENRCDTVLKSKYVHPEDGDVFVTMEKWRVYARKHLEMFSLPNFERFDQQLTQHHLWVKELPWYCEYHETSHGDLVLEDVVESTRPDDDLPPADEYFTCICTSAVRPPSPGKISDAVQCDHCFARFHGICAANGGSCPFCDHHHWDGTIHKDRNWHFCYLPGILESAPDITRYYSEHWKQLEIIVHRLDRLSAVIGQFLSYASQIGNQRIEMIPQVRHYMRKLYKIQFAVSPSPQVSFGLDLAGLHRIIAGQPAPVKPKKRRRPKFVFGQDVDKDWLDKTRCICRGRTAYLLSYPTVECEQCNKLYHAGCVFFPLDSSSMGNNKFTCPLCCLRKNRAYPYSEVRVQHIDRPEQDVYVNVKEMLDTFSREILYIKMLPPYTQTLFVELIRFTPGQPDNISFNGPTPRTNGTSGPPAVPSSSHSRPVQPSSSHSNASSSALVPMVSTFGVNGVAPSSSPPSSSLHHAIPPPPWSRWGTVTTPLRPPATMRRNAPDPSRATTPSSARKRKQTDEPQSQDEAPASSRSPKRRVVIPPPHPTPQPTPPPRSVQTLSPSLALMLSPATNSSPRSSLAYNGTNSLPPVRSADSESPQARLKLTSST